MNRELLTAEDLGKILGMGRNKDVEFCRSHNVFPVNTAPDGSRRRLRWIRQQVMTMLNALPVENGRPSSVGPAKSSLLAMSARELRSSVRTAA